MRGLKISRSITHRETASLDKYLNDISKKEMISPEEEIELARQIRQGNQEALAKLTTANLRFVVSVAKQYQHQGLGLEDLINEGNVGLMKAASRFDETRGFKFISYAVWWIRQSIMQAVAEQSRIIRLPQNKVSALHKIRRMQSSLEQQLERAPTIEELAAELPISEEEIRSTLAASVQHTSSDMVMGDDNFTLGDTFADQETLSPDGMLLLDSRDFEIRHALTALSEKEREVVVYFYGIGNTQAFSLDEIGNMYGLSRERVRQIKEKAIRKLQRTAKNKQLKSYLE